MTDFSDMLRHDAVLTNVVAANKKAVLQCLATTAAGIVGTDAKTIADRLGAREKLGSTGFGGGVAIPHAKLEGLAQVTGVFDRLLRDAGFLDKLRGSGSRDALYALFTADAVRDAA